MKLDIHVSIVSTLAHKILIFLNFILFKVNGHLADLSHTTFPGVPTNCNSC